MWVHLIFNSTGVAGLCCDGFGLEGGVGGCGWAALIRPSLRGRKGAEVLAQSAHHLLSGGGRGLYSFHITLSLTITPHTNTAHWGVSAQSTHLMQHPPPSLFLKAEWAIAWLEWWLHTRAVLNTPNTCFLSSCTCSVGPQGSAVCLPCCCEDWAIPH